jgi:hypothetical protein
VADAFAKCGQMAKKMPGHSISDKAGVAMVEAEEMARRAAAAAGWLHRAESPHAAPKHSLRSMTFINSRDLESAVLMADCCTGAASINSLAGGQLLTEAAGGGRDEGLVRMIGRIVEGIKILQPGNVSIIPAGACTFPAPILFSRAPAAPRALDCALQPVSLSGESKRINVKSEERSSRQLCVPWCCDQDRDMPRAPESLKKSSACCIIARRKCVLML